MSIKLEPSSPDVSRAARTTFPELDDGPASSERGPVSHHDRSSHPDRTTRRDSPASVRGRRRTETDDLHAALDEQARRAFLDAVADSQRGRQLTQRRRAKTLGIAAGVVVVGVVAGLWLARMPQGPGASGVGESLDARANSATDLAARREGAVSEAQSPGTVGLSAGAKQAEIAPKAQPAAKSAKAVPAASAEKAAERKASLETGAQDATPSEAAAEGAAPRRWFGAK